MTKTNYIEAHGPWSLEERKAFRLRSAQALRFFKNNPDAQDRITELFLDVINDPESPWIS
jgi:hypothetical protein